MTPFVLAEVGAEVVDRPPVGEAAERVHVVLDVLEPMSQTVGQGREERRREGSVPQVRRFDAPLDRIVQESGAGVVEQLPECERERFWTGSDGRASGA